MSEAPSDDTPAININGLSHDILCGTCKAPVAFRGEPDPDSGEVGCAFCDNWAAVKEAADIAVEYAKDEGQLMLNRMAQDTARKSKMMTFSGDTAHKKAHRFIVELKL